MAALIVFSACKPQTPANVAKEVANSPATSTAPSAEPQVITFVSAGDVVISGLLRNAPAPNSPAVLLLHQWKSDRRSYDELGAALNKLGFAVLAIDGRGFGESTKTTDGRSVSAGRDDATVAAMKSDVDNSFKFLSNQKNVDPNRIGIVGASYGSSLAVIYAAENKQVKSVALLSPGINYFGNIPTEPAVKDFGERSLLIVAAEDDRESAETVRQLGAINSKYETQVYPRGGHGTGILKAGVGLDELLIQFLKRSL